MAEQRRTSRPPSRPSMLLQATPRIDQPPALWELMRRPLPHQGAVNRWIIRGLSLLARRQIACVQGLEHVSPARDPFILALNHSTRFESLLVPGLLILHREGRLIHFLADWNYRLVPGVGFIYRRAETVTVIRKPARPRVLDLLKPFYRHPLSTLERARRHLSAGRSVGIFPEGRVNRDPQRLMPGRRGAAYLSLLTGAPVVPVGIRFPGIEFRRPILDRDRMEVDIGTPLFPPRAAARLSSSDLNAWHAVVMGEISRLSGKHWSPTQGVSDEQARPCEHAPRRR